VELVRQIEKSLYNPIWTQVRQPAPWDANGETWQKKAQAEPATLPLAAE